jgi:hypothetical protein
MSDKKKNEQEEMKPQTSAQAMPEGSDREAEVLYQRLGNTVYAFSVVDDELYFAPVTQENMDIPADGEV